VSGDTAVIGAYVEDGGAGDPSTDSGAAYVFARSGTVWSEQAILRSSDVQTNDYFGYAVAVSGDTAVIGAYNEDGGAGDPVVSSGAVYVFTRSGASWSEQSILRASDAQASDYFGYAVAVSGDTAVIGAYREDGGAGDPILDSGAAYVFARSGAIWSEQSILRASDAQSLDFFGNGVAVDEGTAVIGAYVEDGGAGDPSTDSGAAYLFTSCIHSAQTGSWSIGSTWEGGSAPTIADGACVHNSHTVTLDGNVAVDTLQIFSGGIFDWATFSLTAENGAWNYGTMQQTQTVDGSGAVNFLQIRDSGDTVDQYRGLDFAAGTNLGVTAVQVMGNTAVCNNNDGGAYRNRCFMANPTNAGTVNITLHTTPGEDDLTDDAFFQYAGSNTWTQGAACNDGTGVGGTCTGSATFASPAWFLVGSGASNPTAVTLQTISASTNNTLFIVMAMMLVVGLGTAAVLINRRN
jgi:hypothetical protein